MPPSQPISRSAGKVLRALVAKGEATYNELLVRVRPMSEAGLTGALFELDSAGLVYLSPKTGLASATDGGREAAMLLAR